MVKATIKENNTLLKLSIQVSLNGLSFCILNTQEKEVIFYKKIEFEQQMDPVKILTEIELEYKKNEELQFNVDEVLLLFSNELYTLVPQNLFKEGEASNYLKLNAKILQNDFVAYDEIVNYAMVNVYIPYANITNHFFEKYGEFEYKHSITVLVNCLMQLPANSQPQVYLLNRQSSYDLVVIEKGRLILCNTFSYSTKEDFIYYLLFTVQQLQLDPEVFELVLLGDINRDSKLYDITYKYVKNVRFHGPFHDFSFSAEIKPQMDLEEYLLLKSFQCA